MSNVLYERFAAMTLRLLTAKGVAVTVERDVPGGSFNSATGMNSAAPSVLSTDTKAISKAIKAADAWKLPSGKHAHVRQLLLAASGMDFAPEAGDRIPSFEGAGWTVAPDGVRPINPDGQTPIAYECWVIR